MTRASERAGGADDRRARARRRSAAPSARTSPTSAATYSAADGDRRAVVGHAEPAADDRRTRARRPAAASSRLTSAASAAARRSGSSAGDLRPDVHVDGHQLQRAARRRVIANSARRVVERHAELVDLQAGRNVRMALRVDVRVARGSRRARRRPSRWRSPRRAPARPADSTLIALTPSADGALELRRRLADAGEHDVGGLERRPLRATSISQIELASAALPSPRSSRATASVELAFSA